MLFIQYFIFVLPKPERQVSVTSGMLAAQRPIAWMVAATLLFSPPAMYDWNSLEKVAIK